MEKHFLYHKLPIRTVIDENEQIWFAGIDVCNVLQYENAARTIHKLLDDDEKKLAYLRGRPGQRRKALIINEPGLYSLVLNSTKPEAKTFKRWITHVILPLLRKTGRLVTEEAIIHEQSLLEQAEKLNNLNIEKYSCQKKNNELRNAIKIKTAKLISLAKTNINQLELSFNKK